MKKLVIEVILECDDKTSKYLVRVLHLDSR